MGVFTHTGIILKIMTIQFEIETGAGSETATSYATVDQFKQYWQNRGVAISDNDIVIQAHLNVGAEYLDLNNRYIGCKTDADQRREWPRCLDNQSVYNNLIYSNEIPSEIIDASCYLAYQNKINNLWPIDEGVSSRSLGPVSTNYKRFEGFKSFPYIDTLLSKYLSSMPGIIRVN